MLIAWAAIAGLAQQLGRNKKGGGDDAAIKAEMERKRAELEKQRIEMLRPKIPFR